MSSPAQPSSLADREALWTQFLQRWPLDQLARMTLRDYNQAGEDDHFCRWLEKRTEALGSIWGGSSLKFGIYSRSSSATKEPSAQKGVMQDEHYGWYAKYGRTAEEAFAAIRALIVQTAQAARAGRLDEVEGIDLWPIVRRKIAFLYQDREQPCILPVYMAPLLRQVWPGPGEAPEDGVALYQAFMARRGSQPVLAYADGIWAQIEAAQAREAAAAGEAPPASSHATLQAQPMPALNQILYGPPGTGKTFATIEEALAILDPDHLAANRSGRAALKDRFDALVQEQRIRFVTFHQSFSYEDFVEGLRATTHEDSGQIAYEVVDGVFKSLCEAAAAKVMRPQEAAAEEAPIELGGRRIWKMSLGNTLGSDAAIYEECIERGYALLGYGGSVDFTGAGTLHDRRAEGGEPADGLRHHQRDELREPHEAGRPAGHQRRELQVPRHWRSERRVQLPAPRRVPRRLRADAAGALAARVRAIAAAWRADEQAVQPDDAVRAAHAVHRPGQAAAPAEPADPRRCGGRRPGTGCGGERRAGAGHRRDQPRQHLAHLW